MFKNSYIENLKEIKQNIAYGLVHIGKGYQLVVKTD